METDKRFDELKQKLMHYFGDYLKAVNELYAAKTTGRASARSLENELDKRWEEWMQSAADCNHFLVVGTSSLA